MFGNYHPYLMSNLKIYLLFFIGKLRATEKQSKNQAATSGSTRKRNMAKRNDALKAMSGYNRGGCAISLHSKDTTREQLSVKRNQNTFLSSNNFFSRDRTIQEQEKIGTTDGKTKLEDQRSFTGSENASKHNTDLNFSKINLSGIKNTSNNYCGSINYQQKQPFTRRTVETLNNTNFSQNNQNDPEITASKIKNSDLVSWRSGNLKNEICVSDNLYTFKNCDAVTDFDKGDDIDENTNNSFISSNIDENEIVTASNFLKLNDIEKLHVARELILEGINLLQIGSLKPKHTDTKPNEQESQKMELSESLMDIMNTFVEKSKGELKTVATKKEGPHLTEVSNTSEINDVNIIEKNYNIQDKQDLSRLYYPNFCWADECDEEKSDENVASVDISIKNNVYSEENTTNHKDSVISTSYLSKVTELLTDVEPRFDFEPNYSESFTIENTENKRSQKNCGIKIHDEKESRARDMIFLQLEKKILTMVI